MARRRFWWLHFCSCPVDIMLGKDHSEYCKRHGNNQRNPEQLAWQLRLQKENPELSNQEARTLAQKAIERKLPIDFELPYLEPKNEHEDAWNDLHVNGPPMSGRIGW